jgi:hypothetical protein
MYHLATSIHCHHQYSSHPHLLNLTFTFFYLPLTNKN